MEGEIRIYIISIKQVETGGGKAIIKGEEDKVLLEKKNNSWEVPSVLLKDGLKDFKDTAILNLVNEKLTEIGISRLQVIDFFFIKDEEKNNKKEILIGVLVECFYPEIPFSGFEKKIDNEEEVKIVFKNEVPSKKLLEEVNTVFGEVYKQLSKKGVPLYLSLF